MGTNKTGEVGPATCAHSPLELYGKKRGAWHSFIQLKLRSAEFCSWSRAHGDEQNQAPASLQLIGREGTDKGPTSISCNSGLEAL